MALERSILLPEIKSTIPTLMIALDIDDTLASAVFKDELEKNYISWFRENNLIINAIEKHLLHPGVIEFIRYLYENPHIKFCFFSNGKVERNNLFVSELLRRALCDNTYQHALTEEEFISFEKNMKENNIFSNSSAYKDLKKVILKLGGDLNSTLLVDDQRANLRNGNIKNGLIIQYADELLFSDTLTTPSSDEHYASGIRHVNHIFYLTGLLEKLFSSHPKPILQSLFEFQYKEDGVESAWLTKYGVALVSYENHESLNMLTLQDISYHHDNVPVLINITETNEFLIFGKPNGKDWALTFLDPMLKSKFTFPSITQKSFMLELQRQFYDDNYREDIDMLCRDVKNKNGHTAINYEPRLELYKDKALYLNGLTILQRYASKPLEFYGRDANEFFGLIQNRLELTNISSYSPFWSESVDRLPEHEKVNEAVKKPSSCVLL